MKFWGVTLYFAVFYCLIFDTYQIPHNDGKHSSQTARLFDIIMHSNYSRVNHQKSDPYSQIDALIIPNQNEDATHIQKIPRKNSKSTKFNNGQNQQTENVEAKIDSPYQPVRGHFITYIPKVTTPIPPFRKLYQFNSDEQVVEDISDQLSQNTEDQFTQQVDSYQQSILDQDTQQVDSYQQSILDQDTQQVDPYQQSILDQDTQQVDPYQQNIPNQDTQQVDSYQQSILNQDTQQVDPYQQSILDQDTQQVDQYQQNIPNEDTQQVDSYQQSILDQDTQQVDPYQQNIPNQDTQQVETYQQTIPNQNVEEIENLHHQSTEQIENHFYQQNIQDQNVENIENYENQQNLGITVDQNQDTEQIEDSPYQQNIPVQNVESADNFKNQQNVEDVDYNLYQQSTHDQNPEENHDNVYQQNHFVQSALNQFIHEGNYQQQGFLGHHESGVIRQQSGTLLQPSVNNQQQNPSQQNQFYGIHQFPNIQPNYGQPPSTNDNVKYFGQSTFDKNLQPASDRNVQYFGIPSSSHSHGSNSQNIYKLYRSNVVVSSPANKQTSDISNNQHYGYLECPNGATGMFPYALDCKQFLNCWNGRGSIQNCAPGTVFNPQTIGCDFPDKVNCSAYKSQANYFDTEKYPSSYLGKNRNTQLVEGNKQKSNRFVRNRIQEEVDIFCPTNFIGLKPHPTNCSKYVNCNKNGASIEECILGMKFNPKSSQCDFPKFVDCKKKENQQLISESAPLVDFPLNKNPECPQGVSGLIAHPFKCELFLNCVNGQTFVQNCGPGTVFNPNILACDYPYNVNCEHKSNLLGNSNTTPNSYPVPTVAPNLKPHHNSNPNSNQKPYPDPQIDIRMLPKRNYYTTNIHSEKYVQGQENSQLNQNNLHKAQESSSTSTQTDGRPRCPVGVSGLIPHPTKCNLFLNCQNGRTVIQECGPGTEFNPNLLACDFPNNVNCQQSGKVIQSNVGSKLDRSVPPLYNQNLDIQSEKYQENKWIGTIGNQQNGYVQTTWKSEENARPQIGSINHSSSDKTISELSNNIQCPDNFSGLMSHPTQCDLFVNCNNGKTMIQKCGPGTVFNQNIKACDFPHNVNCVRAKTLEGANANQNLDVYHTQHNHQYHHNPQNPHNLQNPQYHHNPQNHYNHQNYHNYQNHHHRYGSWSQNGSFESWHRHHNLHHSTVANNSEYETTSVGGDTSKTLKEREELDLWYKFVHEPTTKTELVGESSNTFSYSTLGNQDSLKKSLSQVKPTSKPPKKSNCFPHKFECSPDMCLNLAYVCDGIKHCPNGADEENCKNTMENVVAHKGKRLVRHDVQRWFSVTLNKCAQYCETSKTFECKSFNYRASDGECILSDEVVGQTGDMENSYQFDFYEMKKHSVNCDSKYTCDNLKCIELHQACDGIDNCGDGSDEKYCGKHASEFGVRLVGSKNMNEGRLEVKMFGRWGAVCDDKFSQKNAEVACRELGYPLGAVQVLHNPLYFAETNNVQNPNNTLILMDDVNCLGNETSLKECQFNGWGVHNCKSDEVVGVVCKTSKVVCPKDYWLCAISMECIPLAFLCDHVDDCIDKSDESPSYCEAKTEVRLANGSTPLDGRVEIRIYGVWGTICDDDFTDNAATVVCHQLGYDGPARAKKGGMYGPGSGPIWLDQVSCFGNETSVEKCLHNEPGQHNCEHSEDVGVVCSRSYDSRITNGYKGIYKPSIPHSVIHTNTLELDDVLPTTCGVRNEDTFLPNSDLSFRVVAGSIAKKGHYPWQASLRVKGQSKTSHWCGGVIITHLHVLTAAHCLIGFSKGIYVIRAGDYESEIDEGTEQEAYIEEFYLHESFRKGHHMNNDIAIIKLKGEGFHLGKHIQAICLPNEDTYYVPGKNCTISGWGSTQSGKLSAALQLRAGWIPIQSEEVCRQPEVYGDNIKDGMFCAGNLDQGVDSCDGDSGGPLACLDNGYFTVFGITSWGQHCGYANKPGVYVKIGYYRKWIDETILKSLK